MIIGFEYGLDMVIVDCMHMVVTDSLMVVQVSNGKNLKFNHYAGKA